MVTVELAARFPNLLPPLSAREAFGVTVIRSIIGQVLKVGLWQKRQSREPYHSGAKARMMAVIVMRIPVSRLTKLTVILC